MKKAIFVVVVLAATLPAGASVDIEAYVIDEVYGEWGNYWVGALVRLAYDATSESNSVRAFALDITIEGDANIVDVNCLSGDYNIYPGSIWVDSRGNVTDRGSCICSGSLPGTLPGLDSNGVTVEMASAYQPGAEPGPADSNVLLEFIIAGRFDVEVKLAQNVIRGGIVMENPNERPTVNLTGCVMCIAETWNDCGPTCWHFPNRTQCHGDADGDGDVDTADWPDFRDAFAKVYPDPAYRPCADYDRDGDIDTLDWPEFRDNFAKNPPADCRPGDFNGIYGP